MAKNNFAVSCLEIVSCLTVSTFMTLVSFSCFFVFLWLAFSAYWYIPMLYLVWYFYDRDTPFRQGRTSSTFRNFFLWRYLASYFPINLHKTVDLDPSKNYLFAFHPHGLFSYSGFANFAMNATGFDEMFPGIKIHFTVLNGQFTFPFYRDYVIWAGYSSSNASSIDYKLSEIGPGHSVWLAVGGHAEILLAADANSYTLKLKNRKGFIRRVLKTGASAVPVFSFNEHRIYDTVIPEKGSAAYYFQRVVKFLTKVTVPIIRGRCWYFLPYRRPIDTVIGAPIDFAEPISQLKSFEKGQEPPEALVDECHKIYLDALRKLYDEHKARFGDENTPLIFV